MLDSGTVLVWLKYYCENHFVSNVFSVKLTVNLLHS